MLPAPAHCRRRLGSNAVPSSVSRAAPLSTGKQIVKSDRFIGIDDNARCLIARAHLPHQLAAPAAWRDHYAALINGDYQQNLRLPSFEHLCNGCCSAHKPRLHAVSMQTPLST